ncbi:MAG: hypothetical protein A4E34_01093 [Methanoregula sp. PtaU1.Bin006]|nr:MAG: hypothetical protein A4E33_01694 [Methanoregula sp. PtaB.Bin085]OPY35070.1 MAG: hypothetical protein A4E34_01093 [Methanoregula sp. PtaU1.Bin006]
MDSICHTTFKKLHPKKGFIAPYIRFPWGYDESLIGKEVNIYKTDTGFIIQFKQDSSIQKVYDVKPIQKPDYESAAIPLSHGGAIPHNIGVCANKMYGRKGYEYPLSAVTFSFPGFSFEAMVPNLAS